MRNLVILVTLLTAACGDDSPAYVAGTYAVNTTNRDNGCMFDNWVVGETGTATVVLAQTEGESDVTLTVEGIPGAYLAVVLGQGGNVMDGTVDGSSITTVKEGIPSASEGNCTWTGRVDIHATIDGDFLEGRIDYSLQTNGGSDCGFRDDCVTFQEFNGTRPPP